jgi:biopolymer transport protein TolQ
MTVTQDLSLFALVAQATAPVLAVMAILVIVSAMSWAYIFQKFSAIRRAQSQTDEFEKAFLNFEIGALFAEVTSMRRKESGKVGALERIFEAGMKEFNKPHAKKPGTEADPGAPLDGARRAMRAAYQREMDGLETHLAFLASVGSVSPYVGLFGTVWGIMNSFRGLSNLQQTTLAAVAPGIAEALIATAIGLFAAIPAVVAYNRYSHDIDRLAIRFESFIEEFSNVLTRQVR